MDARRPLLLLALALAGCPAPAAPPEAPKPKASATRSPAASATPTATPAASARPTARPSASLPPVPTAPPAPAAGQVMTIVGPADPLAPNGALVDGPAATARMASPWGLAIDPTARPIVVYVADPNNNRVRKVAQDGAGWTVTTLAAADGQAIEVLDPHALALDAAASPPVLYVGEHGRQRIRALTLAASGTTDQVLAGGPDRGFADGPGPAARFDDLYNLVVDAKRRRLIATDRENHRLRAIALDDPAHAVTTLAGTGAGPLLDGPLALATLDKPTGLALRGDRLAFTEAFCTVRTVDLAAATPATRLLAGGLLGYQDGFFAQVAFQDPVALAYDAQGRLLVADASNHRIRRVTPLGDAATVAGSGAVTGFGQPLVAGALADGPADQARFYMPFNLAVDADGAIWIADHRNCALRRLLPTD